MRLPKILVALVCVPTLAAAQIDYETEDDLALEAYYAGRLDVAEERWKTCTSLEPPAVTERQLATTAANLALTTERLGRRDEAIEWARRSVPDAPLGQLAWFRAQESLGDLCADPRFGAIAEELEVIDAERLDELDQDTSRARADVERAREEYERSVIEWQDGHSGVARELVFDPRGERLLSMGRDRTVRLWSLGLDQPPVTLGLHSANQVDASFSVDGELILVEDGLAKTATLYDGRSGDLVMHLHERDVVLDAAFGRRNEVWTLSSRGRFRRVDSRTGRTEVDLQLDVRATTIDVSRDGSIVLILGEDGRARRFDVENGRIAGGVGPAELTLRSADFFADGRIALFGADGRLHLLPENGRGDAVVLPIGHRGVRWETDDGSRLMASGGVRRLELWDTRTGALAASLLPPASGLERVARGPNGLVAASHGGNSSLVSIWDSRTGEVLSTNSATATVRDVEFSPDGSLAISLWAGIVIADREPASSGRQLASHSGRVNSIAIGSDGVAASGLGGGYLMDPARSPLWSTDLPPRLRSAVRVWDLATGELTLDTPGRNSYVTYAPDGRTLGVSSPRSGNSLLMPDGTRVSLPGRFDIGLRFAPDGERIALTRAGEPRFALLAEIEGSTVRPLGSIPGIGTIDSQDQVVPAQFALDGGVVVACLESNEILVADGFDASEVERLQGHTGAPTWLAFDEDETRLVSSSGDGTARVWDFAPPFSEHACALVGHEGTVWCCAFAPGGDIVATGGEDGTVRLWDAATGNPLAVLTGHGMSVRRIAFHPLTGDLVSASYDGTVRIWDIETGAHKHVLRGHTARVKELAFAPDGRIVTCAEDATVRVWSATGKLLATRVEYDGSGWLTFEPGGRYVAGGDAAERARVRVKGKLYPLSSYAAILEDPEAVRLSLAGEFLPALSLADAPILSTTTNVTGAVDEPKTHLAISFEDSYGLEDITIERDGELWASGLDIDGLVLERRGRSGRLIVDVPFADGASKSVVRVRATNVRAVKSTPVTVRRTYVPPAGELFLITIAVADYDDDRLDLRSPLKDADALAARMKAEEGRLYESVHEWRLKGREVTRPALDRLLPKLVDRAGPEDTVMVFVAGHGALDPLERYFFLTPDATPEDVANGIPREQLERLVTWRDLAAERKVLLLDTCHAGSDERTRGVDTDRAYTQEQIDDLAGGGLYVVAGSSKVGTAG